MAFLAIISADVSYRILVVKLAKILSRPSHGISKGLAKKWGKVRVVKPQVYSKRFNLAVLCAICESV